MRLPRPLAAAVAATLVLTAACGGDDDENDATDDPTTTTEAADEETTTTEADEPDDETTTTASDDGEGTDPLEELARSLLITIDELAIEGFVDAGYTPTDGPNQCGFDLDAEHPSQVLVGTTLGHEQLGFEQEIRIYDSVGAAAAAFEAGLEGARCDDLPDGTTFTEPADLTEAVGGDSAVTITATNPQLQAVVIGVLLSDSVVSFTFVSTPPGAAEELGAPNPVDVAAFGVGKIEAAISGD